MNKMIEKVAKAIGCIDANRCPFALSNIKEKREKRGTCSECIEAGKDAIAAIREPTDEMKNIEGIHWGYNCHVCGGLAQGWYKMIDAALKEY